MDLFWEMLLIPVESDRVGSAQAGKTEETDPHSPQPAGPLRRLDEKANSFQSSGFPVSGFSLISPIHFPSSCLTLSWSGSDNWAIG